MAAPPVYADATVLIGLARIGRLHLLSLYPTPIRVTATVWDEIAGDASKPGVSELHQARAARLLTVVIEGDSETYPELDKGESSVLTAAAATGGAVLIDERKARTAIAAHSELRDAIPHVSGLIGLILLAKQRGRINAVKPLLDGLIGRGFWIGPGLYRAILLQARESD